MTAPTLPVWMLLCDRCGHSYRCHQLTPLCLDCAVANDASEHRGDIPRPLTTLELIYAFRAARTRWERSRW